MTDTKSLSERLRERSHIPTCIEAADALDAKDKEIERLDILDLRANAALDAKDAEIALLKEGRKLHDELADHLEHELAQQSALLAQAAAALESLTKDPPSSLDEPDTDCEVVLKMREIAREALTALRAKEHP